MSQQNLSTTAANFKAPSDLFAILTVGGTVGNLSNVQVGELVTAAGGGVAKVSGFGPTANTLRVKAVKGAISTWSGALTFNKSAAAAMTATSLAYKNEIKHTSGGTADQTVTEYTYQLTDRGFEVSTNARATSKASTPPNVVSAVRFGASKAQTADSTIPTYTYSGSANGNYSKALTPTLRFKLTSTEALAVTGAPTLALLFFGSQAKNATYNATISDSMNLFFDYTLDGTTAAGAMVSAGAITGTINDIGGSAVTPSFSGNLVVTGIVVTA